MRSPDAHVRLHHTTNVGHAPLTKLRCTLSRHVELPLRFTPPFTFDTVAYQIAKEPEADYRNGENVVAFNCARPPDETKSPATAKSTGRPRIEETQYPRWRLLGLPASAFSALIQTQLNTVLCCANGSCTACLANQCGALVR